MEAPDQHRQPRDGQDSSHVVGTHHADRDAADDPKRPDCQRLRRAGDPPLPIAALFAHG